MKVKCWKLKTQEKEDKKRKKTLMNIRRKVKFDWEFSDENSFIKSRLINRQDFKYRLVEIDR